MKRFATALLLLLATTPLRAADNLRSARQTFMNLYRALKKNDSEQARRIILGVRELQGFARWQVDTKAYQRRVEEFLQGFSAELNSGVALQQERLVDVLIVPQGKKSRRRLVLAVVHASFKIPGHDKPSRPMPFFLLEINGRWKLWLRR